MWKDHSIGKLKPPVAILSSKVSGEKYKCYTGYTVSFTLIRGIKYVSTMAWPTCSTTATK